MFGVTILCAKLTNNVLIKKKNSKKEPQGIVFLRFCWWKTIKSLPLNIVKNKHYLYNINYEEKRIKENCELFGRGIAC